MSKRPRPTRRPDLAGGALAMLDNSIQWTFAGRRDEGEWMNASGRWQTAAGAAEVAGMWLALVAEAGEAGEVRLFQIEELTAE